MHNQVLKITLSMLVMLMTVSGLSAQTSETDSVRPPEEDTVKIGNLEWINPVERALDKAQAKKKPVLMLRVLGHLSGEI